MFGRNLCLHSGHRLKYIVLIKSLIFNRSWSTTDAVACSSNCCNSSRLIVRHPFRTCRGNQNYPVSLTKILWCSCQKYREHLQKFLWIISSLLLLFIFFATALSSAVILTVFHEYSHSDDHASHGEQPKFCLHPKQKCFNKHC